MQIFRNALMRTSVRQNGPVASAVSARADLKVVSDWAESA